MNFTSLGLIDPILKALDDQGYSHPTPIQKRSIPILLKRKDLLGSAQTGTGKTAAFSIPIIQHLHQDGNQGKGRRKIRALIVTPTRELAIQIGENFTAYGKYTNLKNTVIFGGVKQTAQTNALREGVDVLVATPGRLLDLIDQGFISLKYIKYFVLDEADRMLDMGFIHDIRRIIDLLPNRRQSLFFSATMPPDIVKLSRKILGDFEQVVIKPEQTTAEKVDQELYYIAKKAKPKLLVHLLREEEFDSVLIFTRTKHGANRVVKLLYKKKITAAAIHGNKSQSARQKALGDFKSGELQVLVATDIAARGIDVEQLSLVINYELPNIPETYVHRIGRTGRASASGRAISFCDMEERAYLKDIQKLIKQKIEVIEEHPFVEESKDEVIVRKKPQQRSSKKRTERSGKPTHKGRSNGKSRGQRQR
jgi:ATP-dependent RNA helicase RhlE